MKLCQSFKLFNGISSKCCYPSRSIVRKIYTVLGIETSCDDTAAAVIDSNGKVLGEGSHSQLGVHLRNGGVIPPVAKDLHNQHIEEVIVEALNRSNLGMKDLTAIAVTNRPGLPLSLFIGVEFAKKLALKYKKPLIPIHHMEGHALTGLLADPSLSFPFLTLLISGGHCQLAWVHDLNTFLLLGHSLDDAPGEAMDKVARRLKVRNLGPPFDAMSGGEALEILAKEGNIKDYFDFSTFIPLHKDRNCDFSFSGFKTFMKLIHRLEAKQELPPDQPLEEIRDISATLLYSMTMHLLKRLSRALRFLEKTALHELDLSQDLLSDPSSLNKMLIERYQTRERQPLNLSVVVSGGVACNDYITGCIERFCSSFPSPEGSRIRAVIPRPKKLCTDNGIMIAWNGMLKLLQSHQTPSQENSHRERILTTSDDISCLCIQNKVPLGISIREAVSSANIKADKIKKDIFTSYVLCTLLRVCHRNGNE